MKANIVLEFRSQSMISSIKPARAFIIITVLVFAFITAKIIYNRNFNVVHLVKNACNKKATPISEGTHEYGGEFKTYRASDVFGEKLTQICILKGGRYTYGFDPENSYGDDKPTYSYWYTSEVAQIRDEYVVFAEFSGGQKRIRLLSNIDPNEYQTFKGKKLRASKTPCIRKADLVNLFCPDFGKKNTMLQIELELAK